MPFVGDARCLAFEMVGYGESVPEGRDRDISVARQAAYRRGWLDELGVAWDLDAPLERIDGGKHWVPENHPDTIATALKDLLGAVA